MKIKFLKCRTCNRRLLQHQSKYCSPKCRGDRFSEITKEAKSNVIKEPKFAINHLKWAIETYNYYNNKKKIPKITSDEYGLYKYGEYLCRKEKYD